ncbi:MAG: sulfur carrier protein ThiS [Negativicutes bacterium]
MNIHVNGVSTEVQEGTSILTFVIKKGLKPGTVVVERNLDIVLREKWDTVLLTQEDQLQIVSFVGGG